MCGGIAPQLVTSGTNHYINPISISATKKYILDLYVNMTIIMYMNIYITKDNNERLRKLDDMSMSGLINHLLNKHFENGFNNKEEVIQATIQQHVAYEGGNFCKHGFPPKTCKFAKNGKVCK